MTGISMEVEFELGLEMVSSDVKLAGALYCQ